MAGDTVRLARPSAVKNGEVYLIDHSYFSRPGPRIIQGLEILAQLTHPKIFDGLVPPRAVVKLDGRRYIDAPAGGLADYFAPYH